MSKGIKKEGLKIFNVSQSSKISPVLINMNETFLDRLQYHQKPSHLFLLIFLLLRLLWIVNAAKRHNIQARSPT